ncbi:hypothetical protein LIA77_08266 [Sarocladium implicatum]|nr:hypothetical protein LIA77_08266 [Sarocladium implicatum]
MDGSYNQPYGHGQAHGNSPQTPSSATYQTNVNRSKTRKWVEARQQTYDGDDWGTDDFDQEPDSPPYQQQQQPPVPASSRLASYGQRTPSGSVPSPAQPTALHIPPQQQAEPPAQVAYNPANAALSHGPGPSGMASPSQFSAQDQVVSPQHPGAIRSPAAEPQTQHTSAPVHGSYQDSAMTDTGHLDHLGHIGRKNTTRKPVGGAIPVSEVATNNSSDAPAEPPKPEVQGPSADIGPEHGVENVIESSVVAPQGEVVTAQPAEQDAGEGYQLHEGDKIDRQRLSTSPQLPDVARMSAFGADLFAADQKRASGLGQAPREEPEAEQAQAAFVGQNDVPVDAPHPATDIPEPVVAPSPEASKAVATNDNLPTSPETDTAAEIYSKDAAAPSQLWLPSVPGEQTANQEAAAATEMSQPEQQDISPVSEQGADTAAILNEEVVAGGTGGSATLQPGADEPTIAPLRTPSPRASQMPPLATSGARDVPNETAPLHTKNSGGIAHSTSQATRDPEYSPSDYDPKSLQREATFSTVTSSPLKESDILRDEIIKSLSPRNDTAPADFPTPTSQKPVSEPSKEASRESTYTLSGYDSYWAEGQERSIQPAIPEEREPTPAVQAVSEEESSGAAPVVPATSLPVPDAASPGEPTDAGARRRFSWEAEGGATAPVVPAGHHLKDNPQPPVEQVQETAPLSTGDAITKKGNDQGPGQESASDNVDVSHQVSQASTNHAQEQAQAAALDPPSPVSNPGDRDPIPETSDRRPSLAEQKSGVRSEATPVAPSPPAGTHPALASPTGFQNAASGQPLMTFREIMSLPGSQERISKYDEARTRFATIESGLSEWIANLKASHPDHANATAQFNGSLAPPGGEPARVPSPMGSQAPSQQPYYQQYLNASSPTSSGPGKRLGGLSVSGQSASSAFGHSSDKIGTKGKEFMQSAGKMGKGLFSKGKSKLRGTGDKVFH